MDPTDEELDRALAAARPTPRTDFADQVLARLDAPRASTATLDPPASPRTWTWLAVGGALAAARQLG